MNPPTNNWRLRPTQLFLCGIRNHVIYSGINIANPHKKIMISSLTYQ